MTAYPLLDRRQHPRVPGMTVTEPAALDDAQPPPPRHSCQQLGVCQGRGDCDCTPPEAGNVWFAGEEPEDEPMTPGDRLALAVVLLVSAASVIGTVWWLAGSVQMLLAGA